MIQTGFGYCISTYMGDGDPPPSFQGEPILLPINGNAEEIAKKYWNELNRENRIAIFVREIINPGNDYLKIINKFEKREKN